MPKAPVVLSTILLCVLPLTSSAEELRLSETDYELLADVVCWEARGEPESDQIDVAVVVLNRLVKKGNGATISHILHERNQFSRFTLNQGRGACRKGGANWRSAYDAVRLWDSNRDFYAHDATHFAHCRLGLNVFGPKFSFVKRNKSHCFFKERL